MVQRYTLDKDAVFETKNQSAKGKEVLLGINTIHENQRNL